MKSYGIFKGIVRRYKSGTLAVTGAIPSASGDALLEEWSGPEEIREGVSLEYELVSRERRLYAVPPGSVISKEAGLIVGVLFKLEHEGSYFALSDRILQARNLTPKAWGELVEFLCSRVNLLADSMEPGRVRKKHERWEALLRLAESLS